jgi:hypothetical protein
MSAPSSFPLLTIGRTRHPRTQLEAEVLDYVSDPEAYSLIHASKLKSGEDVGTTLIDKKGRCWTILSLRTRGLGGPLWWRLPGVFFGQLYRVEYELAEVDSMSLDQIKDRVVGIVTKRPEDWGYGDGIEAVDDTLDKFIARIRRAKSLSQLIKTLFD